MRSLTILKKLDDLAVADNTIVIYTTDNGNGLMFWPDGGIPIPRRKVRPGKAVVAFPE